MSVDAMLARPIKPPAPWLRPLSLIIVLLVWQLAASLAAWRGAADQPEQAQSASAWISVTAANDRLLPGPVPVLQRVHQELTRGDMLQQLGITLWRVLVTFAVAMVLGSLLGIAMGVSARVNAALDLPLSTALNMPALVTMILCYVWLGLSDLAAVMAVAMAKIPSVGITLREGARQVDRRLLDVAQVYALPRWRRFSRVYLPQLYPYLMAASRAGLALIWKLVLVVELLGRSSGVGFKLGTYFQYYDMAGVLAYTLVFVVIISGVEAWVLRPIDRVVARGRG